MEDKKALFGLTLTEMQEVVKQYGLPGFTAKQIVQWMYQKKISSIDEMTNLSKKAREQLSQDYVLGLTPHSNVQESTDGTKKYLFPTHKGPIEAAYIPDRDRATLCVSSQVGCKMGCLFCMTAKQGFQAHLSAGEIINQIKSLPEEDKLTNVVYMGMGEPFDNLEEVLKSLEIMTAEWGYAWSPRRITVSTIGIIPAMKEFLDRSQCHLAVSLHSPFEEDRQQIMPVENVYPLQEVINEIRSFDFGRQRRVSFEYIMFRDFNDTERHVRELAKLLNGIRCRINLIRFHPIPGSPLEGSPEINIVRFQNGLKEKGLMTTLRASRGEDILAACGLLSTKELVKRKDGHFD